MYRLIRNDGFKFFLIKYIWRCFDTPCITLVGRLNDIYWNDRRLSKWTLANWLLRVLHNLCNDLLTSVGFRTDGNSLWKFPVSSALNNIILFFTFCFICKMLICTIKLNLLHGDHTPKKKEIFADKGVWNCPWALPLKKYYLTVETPRMCSLW